MNFDECAITDLFNLAGVAETAERYDDMRQILKVLVTKKVAEKQSLTIDERNLLSVAYKNVVGSKRQSWRTINQGVFETISPEYLQKYREVLEGELEGVCKEAISLLEMMTGIETEQETENQVFLLKMSADYYRYLAEFKEDESNKDNAEKFYKNAFDLAMTELPETHPTRLGLALNYSVCCYEIMKKQELACQIAKEAFDSAIEKLDTLNDSSYKDSTLIMQLLRDNLTLWSVTENDEAAPTEK